MASALRALAKVPVTALGKPGARAQSLATAAVSAGRVARFTFEAADTAKSAKFYTDALGLRLAPQAAPQRVVAGDGLGLCADVVMLQAGGSSAAAARAAAASGLDGLEFGDSEEDPLIHPFLTIGVSNLKTSARHAKRQFGAVVVEPRAQQLDSSQQPSAPLQEAVFADPDGHTVRALHLFRRMPILSVTLGVGGDVGAAAEAYARVFGLRRVTAPAELAEVHAARPGVPPAQQAVLAFGPAHSSTVLALEPARPPRRGAAAAARDPPAITLAVGSATDADGGSGSLDTVFHHVIGAGWGASPFEPGDASFVCMDPHGNVFQVVGAAAAAGAAATK